MIAGALAYGFRLVWSALAFTLLFILDSGTCHYSFHWVLTRYPGVDRTNGRRIIDYGAVYPSSSCWAAVLLPTGSQVNHRTEDEQQLDRLTALGLCMTAINADVTPTGICAHRPDRINGTFTGALFAYLRRASLPNYRRRIDGWNPLYFDATRQVTRYGLHYTCCGSGTTEPADA